MKVGVADQGRYIVFSSHTPLEPLVFTHSVQELDYLMAKKGLT